MRGGRAEKWGMAGVGLVLGFDLGFVPRQKAAAKNKTDDQEGT